MAKETFTASIELTEDEAAMVRKTAAFFKMEQAAFLSWALRLGLDDAEEHRADARAGKIIDDGIPF
jgi:hypothetical protein